MNVTIKLDHNAITELLTKQGLNIETMFDTETAKQVVENEVSKVLDRYVKNTIQSSLRNTCIEYVSRTLDAELSFAVEQEVSKSKEALVKTIVAETEEKSQQLKAELDTIWKNTLTKNVNAYIDEEVKRRLIEIETNRASKMFE